MIFAIEGPDCSGKTSVFNLLRHSGVAYNPHVRFVSGLPLDPALLPHMEHVEVRQERLWWQLYDPMKVYITDRHLAVSGPVYSAFYKRDTKLEIERWRDIIHVIYIDVPSHELERRCNESKHAEKLTEADYVRVKAIYDGVLKKFTVTRFTAASSKDLSQSISSWILKRLPQHSSPIAIGG